ncbi:MAG: PDZ domain-containing protein [Proteobacteria bacterium]|nr:PDZ domain-containing protein [Pseudomonadota bacterium]
MLRLPLFRQVWLVALATVGICALFAISAVSALRAPGEPTRVAPAQVLAPVSLAPAHKADGRAVITRNMFCSTCTPTSEEPGGVASPFAPPAILIATLVGDDSRATVRVTTTEVQGNWGIGEIIPDVGAVTRISYGSIDVTDSSGRIAKLSLLDAAPAPTIAPAAGAGAATPAPASSPYADRVRKVDEHTYDVRRELVRDLVGGAASGKGGIRAMPQLDERGDLDGLKLVGVRSDSAPAAIGLRSGDILGAIDGVPIKTAQQMIDLYSKLDQLDTVELQGLRAGKPLRIRLNLK